MKLKSALESAPGSGGFYPYDERMKQDKEQALDIETGSIYNKNEQQESTSSETIENDITFFSYMVLEQGALSGKYDTSHPFPADSDRGAVYNPMLPQLDVIRYWEKEMK